MWDVIVVGAGPAGAAAALGALQARPRARVLLLDRADFPRDKVCGDGVAPHALDVLAGLGIADAVAGFAPVPTLALGGPRGPQVSRTMRRSAYVVPRRVFDARLVEAAVARGAVLRRHRVRQVEVGPQGARVDGELTARAVVGADGAHSVVRRSLGIPPNVGPHVAVALRGYAPDVAGQPRQVIRMSGPGWPAYAWSFPIGDGTANVGYGEGLPRHARPADGLTRGGMLDRLTALLPDLVPDIAAVGQLRAHHLPLSTRRPRQPDGPVLLAGDAASLVNPFTGEGIFYAVASGGLAGVAALRGAAAGAAYRRALRHRLGAHLRSTGLTAALTRSPALVAAAIEAAGADQAVFDDLVDLGLGRGRLTGRALAGTLRALPRPGRRPLSIT